MATKMDGREAWRSVARARVSGGSRDIADVATVTDRVAHDLCVLCYC